MSFKVIVITTERFFDKEIETIVALFEAGLELLHVRKPNVGENELRNYLEQIPKKYHKRIVIHAHYKLVGQFNLKGIHLTEKERKLNKIYQQKIVSTSFHSTEELLKSRRKYQYVFLSPIFDSISKTNYKGSFIEEELKHLLQKRKNIIALGGITNETATLAKELGFSGVATIGYVWRNKNPVARHTELVSVSC